MSGSERIRAVIVSDGKRGHENQSRVLARMLSGTEPLLLLLRPQVRDGGAQETLLRLRLRLGGPGALSKQACASLVQRLLLPEDKTAFRDFAAEAAELSRAGMLFTISTGTPPATLNLVLARLLGARALVNMTPSLLPRRLFALNIVPAHDVLSDTSLPVHVLTTPLALSYHDETQAQFLAGQLSTGYGLDDSATYWGVAVGGPSKACPWHGDRVLDELAALYGQARGEGARLLVTTSRRTPAYITGWIKQHFQNSPHVPYLLDASTDPLNPLPAFYELCQRILITGDSFSMASEAIQAGHCPLILQTAPLRPGGKLGRALKGLANEGLLTLGDDALELPQRMALMRLERATPNRQYAQGRQQVRAALGIG
jgi:mitochondrial fission protein ELM1